VSSLPTPGWGWLRLRPSWRLPALGGVGLFAGALFTNPWPTLALVCLIYAGMLPLAWRSYARMKAREAERDSGRAVSAVDGIQPPP
jgi:CDP-diacylglycerol---serine O-phosphatidyltransferase